MKTGKFPERLIIAANQNIKEKEYWHAQLSGEWEKTLLPYDIVSNQDKSLDSRYVLRFNLPPTLTEWLIELSRGSHHTLHIILVT